MADTQLRDTINATGGSNAARVDAAMPGQPSTVDSDIAANDFFAHYDLPQEGDAVGAHHLFTSLGGGYQPGMERNAALKEREVRFPDGRVMTISGAAKHFAAKTKAAAKQCGCAKAAGVYNVKAAGLFTTDQRAPRPDEVLPRTGREIRVGNGATGGDLIAKEFNDLAMSDTNTLDDFRGLGKISAWRVLAGAR